MSNGTRAAVTSLIRVLAARHATADATDAELLKRFVWARKTASGVPSGFELLKVLLQKTHKRHYNCCQPVRS
jgi:hypothetical protein